MSAAIPATMLLDPAVLDDPCPFYERLRTEAPVWRVPGTDVFVASTFEMVADATARVQDFSSNMRYLLYRDEAGLPARLSFGGDTGVQTLATADPPIHAIHRGVVFPDLMAKRMTSLEPDVEKIVDGCIARALAEEHTEFMDTVGNAVPITVISQLIGFQGSNPAVLLQNAFDSTLIVGVTVSLDQLGELITKTGEIGAWIVEQLAAVADAPGDDLLGTVARGVADNAMTLDEAVVTLQTLLSAGGESTTSLIGNAVRILAERPDLQGELREHPELLSAFVEEVLRLESPFRHHLRWIPQDTTLGDMHLPAESSLLLFWGSADRDPAEYEAADQVVLDRASLRHHVAFGRGIHHCVGAPLARLEARIVLTALLARTSNIALDPARPPQRVESLMVRRHETLPIIVTPARRA